ncbi:MAG TPA: 4-hydroxythreonine-4-phosphate dehydrogenase PdxA [Fimbriiglobus sp.]
MLIVAIPFHYVNGMAFPRLLITMGDVAGIGPEIVAKAWPKIVTLCEPVVIGDPTFVPKGTPCTNPSKVDLTFVNSGEVSELAGRAAYDWLCFAIDECLAGRADGVVTCPLHKEGLHLAGLPFPGHTEILAERTGAKSHAMLLYDDALKLAVAHVTLHKSVKDAVKSITLQSVLDKIRLLNDMAPRLTGTPARIGVAALNPHASDGGLFGNEEATIIGPAVEAARAEGIAVEGPIPADAIFLPHNRAKFTGIAAMIHDHGHIAMKLLGGRRAVNITAGLPIVRTSVAHGTAYDIAGKGVADESSLVEAVKIAARLSQRV